MPEIEWVILADNAEVAAGRLSLMGGGWDTVHPQTLPTQHFLALAVAIKVPWDEVLQQRELRVDIVHHPPGGPANPLGTGLLSPTRTPLMREGEDQRAQIAVKISLNLDRVGTHEISVTLDGEHGRAA